MLHKILQKFFAAGLCKIALCRIFFINQHTMKPKNYVSIPQPCHEKWEAMIPGDKGRYCASCAKTVVDFSAMSDRQVLDYLTEAKGRLCGRFAPDQLERPLQPVAAKKKLTWWMAALVPAVLFVTKLNARKKIVLRMEYGQYGSQTGNTVIGDTLLKDNDEAVTSKTIRGRILDADSMPIQGASVILEGLETGTATDSLGNFKLGFTSNDSSAKLLVTAIGYERQSFVYLQKNTDSTEITNIILQPLFTSGLIAVAGGISYCRPVKKADTSIHKIHKIFHAEAFKIYPNPAKRGTDIKIDVKKEGNYSIQLLDAGSKLIRTALFDAVKGATVTSFSIPASIAAGVYFTRLINDDTKKQYTEKMVVQ